MGDYVLNEVYRLVQQFLTDSEERVLIDWKELVKFDHATVWGVIEQAINDLEYLGCWHEHEQWDTEPEEVEDYPFTFEVEDMSLYRVLITMRTN